MSASIKGLVRRLTPRSLVQFHLRDAAERSVLLTFDDGPTVGVTPEVLDVLDENNAKALFFLIGQKAAKAPALVRDIVDRGHVVDNHSFSYPLELLDVKDWTGELDQCQKTLSSLCGVDPVYFRPVQGRLRPSVMIAARRSRLRVIHWSFETGEYSYLKGALIERIADNLVERARGRMIVLSHDDFTHTPQMLRLALPRLREIGFDLAGGLAHLS